MLWLNKNFMDPYLWLCIKISNDKQGHKKNLAEDRLSPKFALHISATREYNTPFFQTSLVRMWYLYIDINTVTFTLLLHGVQRWENIYIDFKIQNINKKKVFTLIGIWRDVAVSIITTNPEAEKKITKTVNCDFDRWNFPTVLEEIAGWRRKSR